MQPSYVELYERGILGKIAEKLCGAMARCTLCPHGCGVDRASSASGKCRTGMRPVISSYNAHLGEEAPLVGDHGSGTIFFTNCNLACIYCQNYDISHFGGGREVSYEDCASMMLALQKKGCHNINFVSPTHQIYAIVRALELAVPGGLKVPLVYNSGGYDSVATLQEVNGIFDIYMPDFKYMDPDVSEKLSGAPDYPSAAAAAIREMHRQVGDLVLDSRGVAVRGLLVRHLVLPNNIALTDRIIEFIADLSKNTYFNIMDQYRPEHRAHECFDLRRRVTLQEYDEAQEHAQRAGLTRIDGYRHAVRRFL